MKCFLTNPNFIPLALNLYFSSSVYILYILDLIPTYSVIIYPFTSSLNFPITFLFVVSYNEWSLGYSLKSYYYLLFLKSLYKSSVLILIMNESVSVYNNYKF